MVKIENATYKLSWDPYYTILHSLYENWLEHEIAQWVHHDGSIRRPIAPQLDAPGS